MTYFERPDPEIGQILRSGSQPVVLATILVLLIMIGVGSLALWRATTANVGDIDRAALARLLQARTAQTYEQLIEKHNILEASQHDSIDQLQIVQDELQTVKRLLASEEADKKRLADQVAVLTETVDGLRQSFASAPPEPALRPETRPASARAQAMNAIHHRRSKTKS
jgi:negative regulator of replication initiation